MRWGLRKDSAASPRAAFAEVIEQSNQEPRLLHPPAPSPMHPWSVNLAKYARRVAHELEHAEVAGWAGVKTSGSSRQTLRRQLGPYQQSANGRRRDRSCVMVGLLEMDSPSSGTGRYVPFNSMGMPISICNT